MSKYALALALGTLAAVVSYCGTPPVASVPPPPSLTGRWTGTGEDSQGPELMTWELTQKGNTVTGIAITRAVDTTDGTCASCHKNKEGTLSGTIVGNALSVTMFFPQGGDVPTPICSVTMEATDSGFSVSRIASSYTGEDTCEGPFVGGIFRMDHQP